LALFDLLPLLQEAFPFLGVETRIFDALFRIVAVFLLVSCYLLCLEVVPSPMQLPLPSFVAPLAFVFKCLQPYLISAD
jgi:hypothetical protein